MIFMWRPKIVDAAAVASSRREYASMALRAKSTITSTAKAATIAAPIFAAVPLILPIALSAWPALRPTWSKVLPAVLSSPKRKNRMALVSPPTGSPPGLEPLDVGVYVSREDLPAVPRQSVDGEG